MNWIFIVLLSGNIEAPLTEHPNQASSRDEYWPCQTPTPRHRLEDHPLAHKVSPCDGVGPNCELVYLGIGNIVGSVETDHGRDDSPGTEDS